MTKRALIVIAIIVLVPIITVMAALVGFKGDNGVVAAYGDSIDIIEYDGMTLRRVGGEYTFRFGEYLGKVGDGFTGAPLYRVADDGSGSYYAIAEGAERVLYTKTGELIDGVRETKSYVTRVIFDDYLIEEKDMNDIALIMAADGKKVSVDMAKYKSFRYYDLYLSFDGSAIVTEYFGRLLYLVERETWIYVTPEEREAVEKEYGDKIPKSVYIGDVIEDGELSELLDSYFAK